MKALRAMNYRSEAQPHFNESADVNAAPSRKNMRRHWWWITAMALQALCGFFVAKIPVRPELANVSAVFVVIFALPCYIAVVRWLGRREGVRLLIALGIFALVVESFAIRTGFPYGHFYYGEKIGSLLFGLVPWTVPFAWTPLVCAAVALSRRWTSQRSIFVLLGGALLVAIDMVLDPGAVAQGFWQFAAPGDFYNVPAQNFAGWMLSGSIAAWLFWRLAPRLRDEIPPAGLLGSSLLILSFWSSVCFWMQLWMPALIGVVLLVVSVRVFFSEGKL
jgi:putative membrane protein